MSTAPTKSRMPLRAIGVVADKQKNSQQALIELKKRYKLTELSSPLEAKNIDVVIALGGDGFMLHTLHDYMNHNIPIYGMNCGSVGFLMNAYEPNGLLERLELTKKANMRPLKMTATNKDGKEFEAFAVNEVSLLRKTAQAAKIRVSIDGAVMLSELVADGILVATPAGSSAYNLSVGGSIVPLKSKLLALTPISPFRPRRWRGALLPSKVSIRFDVVNPGKRPVNAVADFNEIRDVVSVEVVRDEERRVRLLFDPGHSLEERILREQFVV